MDQLEGDLRVIVGALDAHARDVYVIIQPDLEDFEAARELLLRDPWLGLRGPDALHLAIAKRYEETLFTLDEKLLACALALGIAAADGGSIGPPGPA